MRRFVTLASSLSLMLGLTAAGHLLAQVEKKDAGPGADTKAAPPAAQEGPKAAESPAATKPIPPEVQAKLDAARRAVAEAIVAAEDAGLVDTSIDPPPILDILITGRAADAAALKAKTDTNPEVGVSPEVFGAWFTGYSKPITGVTSENVRIIPPSKGLKGWYDDRAHILRDAIAQARQAKGGAPTAAPAPAPTAEPKKEEMKKEEPKNEEPNKEEVEKDEPKKDEGGDTPK